MSESMNPTAKVSPLDTLCQKILDEILSHPVSEQNEILDYLRRRMRDHRIKLLEEYKVQSDELSDNENYARTTLNSIIIGELK